MHKDVRIIPSGASGKGQSINFVVAVGSMRQVCCLRTSHQTHNQALAYLHKHRTTYERMAHASVQRGDVEDGVVHLAML